MLVLFLIWISAGNTVRKSWASPLAAATRTIQKLVLFKSSYISSLYGIKRILFFRSHLNFNQSTASNSVILQNWAKQPNFYTKTEFCFITKTPLCEICISWTRSGFVICWVMLWQSVKLTHSPKMELWNWKICVMFSNLAQPWRWMLNLMSWICLISLKWRWHGIAEHFWFHLCCQQNSKCGVEFQVNFLCHLKIPGSNPKKWRFHFG